MYIPLLLPNYPSSSTLHIGTNPSNCQIQLTASSLLQVSNKIKVVCKGGPIFRIRNTCLVQRWITRAHFSISRYDSFQFSWPKLASKTRKLQLDHDRLTGGRHGGTNLSETGGNILAQKYVQTHKRVKCHVLKTIDLHIVHTYIGDSINNYIFANLPVFFIGRETSKTLKT
mgnify:CR=1 FL=1